ncbi:MAG: HDOD domain-containing protein [Oscillospiraceae bacterium]|nr:HDOD domain-containing protein [Oscillospiraceae bacterium]MDE7278286.1 HDOD domain-containing protein [Oscillospiraceae bacterium]
MDSYIVRQALVTEKQESFGYEILYTDNSFSAEHTDDASAANAIENFLSSMDSERFLDGKIAFLTFTPNLLEKGIPKMFKTNKLVIQIEDSLITNPLSQNLITKYKQSGYKIAVVDFEFAPRFFGILDIVDYIKVNFSSDPSSVENIVKIGKSFGKKVIAYNVETQEAYDRAKELGCTYYQGTFVSEKMPTTVKKVNYLQSNFFLLMVAVTKDEPDIDEIENIISRDVSLTFSLLRLVNSAYFALRNKARSVKQALVILGLGQLKQWIYLLSFKQDDGSMPDELIKISFLRATFASELVEYAQDMTISRSEAYLLGMFSTLGKLMRVPLEDALEQLPISDDIKLALLKKEGRTGSLYKLIISYEKADWKTMSSCAAELGIPQSIIAQKYFECVESVNNIWNGLTQVDNSTAEE